MVYWTQKILLKIVQYENIQVGSKVYRKKMLVVQRISKTRLRHRPSKGAISTKIEYRLKGRFGFEIWAELQAKKPGHRPFGKSERSDVSELFEALSKKYAMESNEYTKTQNSILYLE